MVSCCNSNLLIMSVLGSPVCEWLWCFEGFAASVSESSQGEDVDERGLTELLIRNARDRFKYRRGEPQDTEEQ